MVELTINEIEQALAEKLREELGALELADKLFFLKVNLDNYKYWNNPVLDRGPSGAWDSDGVRDPQVIKYNNNTLMMYYNNIGHTGIGIATSTDGINWTKYAGNPVITKDGVSDPYVIKVRDTYYMYTEQLSPGRTYPRMVEVYTSKDGYSWTYRGVALSKDPMISGELLGPATPVVYYNEEEAKFYMFAETLRSSTDVFLCLATSTDGLTFTKEKIIQEGYGVYGRNLFVSTGVHDILKLGDLYLLIYGYMRDEPGTNRSAVSSMVSLNLKDWFSFERVMLRWTRGETLLYEGSGLDLGDWIYWWYSYNDATYNGRIGLCRFPKLGRFQPIMLWENRTVSTAGDTTVYIEPDGNKTTFYLFSSQSGSVVVQVYDEVAMAWRSYYTDSVSANTLWWFVMTGGASRVCLSFTPTAQALVNAWAVIG